VRAAVYDCTLRHARTAPVRHSFAYRTRPWLVDLDDLPRWRWAGRRLASFEARDHLGDPALPIRRNVDDFLAGHGIELAGGRVLMLAGARSLGHVFNPLTVYWCHHADGRLAAVIAEVHNTYGGRHCYLLRTDERGRADAAKTFYVSPFFAVDGTYRMSLPEPADRLALTISLDREGGRPFVATLRGTRRAAGPAALIRQPVVSLAVTTRIKIQGIRLYLRGLPVIPRPAGPPTAARAAVASEKLS
jgi:DUF1365 family protein